MTKNVKTRSRGGLRPAELRGILTTAQNGEGPVLTSAFPDHVARWSRGERLNRLFEDRCDTYTEQGRADQLAVDAEDTVLTYTELDRRANQLARYLLDSSLEADSLLMKGEDVPEGAILKGNPARDVTRSRGTDAPSPALSSGPRHKARADRAHAESAGSARARAEGRRDTVASVHPRHRATANGWSAGAAAMREDVHRRSHARSHRHRRTVSR
jgi:hypothetical protein